MVEYASFQSVLTHWLSEKRHKSGTPIVLVGTKEELRNDGHTKLSLGQRYRKVPVAEADAVRVAPVNWCGRLCANRSFRTKLVGRDSVVAHCLTSAVCHWGAFALESLESVLACLAFPIGVLICVSSVFLCPCM